MSLCSTQLVLTHILCQIMPFFSVKFLHFNAWIHKHSIAMHPVKVSTLRHNVVANENKGNSNNIHFSL